MTVPEVDAVLNEVVAMALIARARDGDVESIRRLYQGCSPVRTYILRRYKDAEFAKEIFHDTVTEIWRGSAVFQGRSKFSTWAIGIARHLAVDALRKRGVGSPLEDDFEDEEPAPEEGPAHVLERRQQRDHVARCLRRLSPKLGEVLLLVYYAEMPQAAIADMLKLNINTVKTRVRDAHLKVRACLEMRIKETA
jgi:RNA polymerase sigma-70 factor (ECF subfamily)